MSNIRFFLIIIIIIGGGFAVKLATTAAPESTFFTASSSETFDVANVVDTTLIHVTNTVVEQIRRVKEALANPEGTPLAEQVNPDDIITAIDLVSLVDNNEIAAQGLIGVQFTVQGVIQDFTMEDAEDTPMISLKGTDVGPNRTSLDVVTFPVMASQLPLASRYRKGDQLIVQGTFNRVFLGNVYLINALILH